MMIEKQWKREQYEINNHDKIQRRVSPPCHVAEHPLTGRNKRESNAQ